jgi:hypothetical protein
MKRGKPHKPQRHKLREASARAAPMAASPSPTDDAVDHTTDQAAADQVSVSNLSLHELFEQQARTMLDSADIDEEQKQAILVAMACPCCGTGGMSYSVKLKRP